MKKKIVVVLSGGLDSSVLLSKLVADGHECRAISIFYGQRHARELKAAEQVSLGLGVEHKIIDLHDLQQLMTGSSQTDSSVEVPHGHYAAENMKLTVVPNRNMILLAVAGAWAISTKSDEIAYAAHSGDHAVYPDCREEFVQPLAQALFNADWHHVAISRPFLQMTKAQIVREGIALDHAFEGTRQKILPLTYSCYEGQPVHCALCGTCQERRSAFRDALVLDPTIYDAENLLKLPDDKLQS